VVLVFILFYFISSFLSRLVGFGHCLTFGLSLPTLKEGGYYTIEEAESLHLWALVKQRCELVRLVSEFD
jgi:hypothetical protein